MLTVYASHVDQDDPLQALKIGRIPLSPVSDGWVRVRASAAVLSYHDMFTLQVSGAHLLQLPRILRYQDQLGFGK